MIMHRHVRPAAVSGLLAPALLASAALGQAKRPDFNKDGYADLVVGVPYEDVGTVFDAGAVNVIYGGATGLKSAGNQVWHQNSANVTDAAEASDSFGAAVAWGDFNKDGFMDLAIGAPFEDVGSVVDAGAVHVLLGSAEGLTATGSQLWTQNSQSILDASEVGDRFGWSLASRDFDKDGFDDLAIGAPGEKVASLAGAGGVAVMYGSAGGLSGSRDQLWSLASPDMLDDPIAGDGFGWTLMVGDFNKDTRFDLAIGVPNRDINGAADAGAVYVLSGSITGLTGTGAQAWTQGSGIGEVVEAGDRFGLVLAAGDFNGDTRADLAIGAAFEGVDVSDGNGGTIMHPAAGMVHVLPGSPTGLTATSAQTWTQTAALGDVEEESDRFGASLAAADFNQDGVADLAIGVPLEAVDAIANAGAVHVLFGSAGFGLTDTGSQVWHQDVAGVADVCMSDDMFGQSMTSADFDKDGKIDLAVAVPGNLVGLGSSAGVMHVLYGSSAGLNADRDALWHQDSPSIRDVAEDYDFMGLWLGSD